MTHISFEVPPGVDLVNVSFAIRLGSTGTVFEAPIDSTFTFPTIPPAPPVEGTHVGQDEHDGEQEGSEAWVRDATTFPGQRWREADIQRILAGSSDKLKRMMRHMASNPDRIFSTSELCGEIDLHRRSLAGMLAGATRRTKGRLPYRHSFFDCRVGRVPGNPREFEWRMRPREARIVRAYFESVDRA